MAFVRLRRSRATSNLRELYAETELSVKDLIMPYFVIEGKDKRQAIRSMPGINRLSVDNLIKDIKEITDLGIRAVLLFEICDKKDKMGSRSYSEIGALQRAVAAIKKEKADVVVITDVCLCGYTSHGHCGIVRMQNAKRKMQSGFIIDNDKTIKILAKIALSHAEAGADFVAPSAMMDGQVGMIREALDKNKFSDVGILAYSAKYSSNFYAPFREALNSHPEFGDRKTYQMDFRNSNEALREIEQDIDEGADIVMVKPALSYLDVIYRAKERFNVPIAAYNVSGEYSLIKTAAKEGMLDERQVVLEILTSMKRAGADLVITYHAKEAAKWISHSKMRS